MINSFKSFLVEEEKTLFFTFGRMNPPTIGHGLLLDKLASVSGKNQYRVYLSHSQDPKKNPLDYVSKVKFVRKMFPKHARSVMLNRKVKNVFDAAVVIYNDGYKNVTMVVGDDRVIEFKTLLEKYNGKEGRHGFYNFSKINVVSAGERDPDAEGVSGASATKQREAAANNDFVKFSQGVPKAMSNADTKGLFNAVRSGMGLKEETQFKNHIILDPVSETRELYISGEIFNVGDEVIVKESNEVHKIHLRGTNYVIIEDLNGNKSRKWIDDIEPVQEKIEVAQDRDIDELPGSQPASFQKGIKAKSTKAARHRHFQKMTKKDDDDPTAYQDAPGDKKARAKGTKPSQYTKKFKQMYGEQSDPIDVAKAKIEREKKADKVRHDRMLDRARVRATTIKNRETK
jgi:hypothetical protein